MLCSVISCTGSLLGLLAARHSLIATILGQLGKQIRQSQAVPCPEQSGSLCLHLVLWQLMPPGCAGAVRLQGQESPQHHKSLQEHLISSS